MEAPTLTLGSNGQITIPHHIRERLGLGPGAKLDIEVGKDKKTIILKRQKTVDEIMAELDKIDEKSSNPKPDPRAKYMTVGEMALEGIKYIKDDTWDKFYLPVYLQCI